MMAINRRHFLQWSSALLCAGKSTILSANETGGWLLSALDNAVGEHRIMAIDLRTGTRHTAPVAVRYHAAALQGSRAVFVARRPGREMAVIDLRYPERVDVIHAMRDTHFFGHAAFSQDGRFLYVTENRYGTDARGQPTGTGLVGIYELGDGCSRVDEIALGGIGPHELRLLPNGHTLVVAIGGILTHPDYGRESLNTGSIESELVYIDVRSRNIIARTASPTATLSLRHLAVANDGMVIVGAQEQNPQADPVPLLFAHRLTNGSATLQPLSAESWQWQQHAGYIASVGIAHGTIVATSPRGNVLSLWDLSRGQLRQQVTLNDVAGVTWSNYLQGFVASTGMGQLVLISPDGATQRVLSSAAGERWDNHLTTGDLFA